MKQTTTLLLLLAASLMQVGCASTKLSDVAPAPMPQLAQPDSKLTKDCNDPVVIPSKGGNLEKLWMQDRVSLVECKAGKRAVVGFFADRDARLMGMRK